MARSTDQALLKASKIINMRSIIRAAIKLDKQGIKEPTLEQLRRAIQAAAIIKRAVER